jgi:hypothetical protein
MKQVNTSNKSYLIILISRSLCLVFSSDCNSLNNGNSFGFMYSDINDGVYSNGLPFIFHKYCQTSLINGDLFLTFKVNGHE